MPISSKHSNGNGDTNGIKVKAKKVVVKKTKGTTKNYKPSK